MRQIVWTSPPCVMEDGQLVQPTADEAATLSQVTGPALKLKPTSEKISDEIDELEASRKRLGGYGVVESLDDKIFELYLQWSDAVLAEDAG